MSRTPRTITNDELKAAARKAIDDGTLLALAPGFSGDCFYEAEIDGKTYNCAIGAVLTATEIETIKQNDLNSCISADGLHTRSVIRLQDPAFANRLQYLHDRIAATIITARAGNIKAFKSLIDYSEAGAV